jgi:carbon storage regulator
MLVISRKNGQKVMINDNIVITVVEARNGQVKIAIEADKDVKIYREEIYYQVKLANLVGKNTNVDSVDSISDLIKNDKIKLNDDIKQTSDVNEVELDEKSKSKTIIIKKNDNQKNL